MSDNFRQGEQLHSSFGIEDFVERTYHGVPVPVDVGNDENGGALHGSRSIIGSPDIGRSSAVISVTINKAIVCMDKDFTETVPVHVSNSDGVASIHEHLRCADGRDILHLVIVNDDG